jgi:methyl-accepting chemotaxis protein
MIPRMMSSLFGRRRDRLAAPPSPDPSSSGNAQVLVQQLAQQASLLGRDAAQTRGALEDTQQVVQAQVQAMHALMAQLDGVTRAQDTIAAATATSLHAVDRARGAVGQVEREVNGIVQVLHEVSSAAEGIGQIALQTRLVAFNASVEAHRAGAAGLGFGVVADAVKDLATRVETASRAIQGTLLQLNERIDRFARETLYDDAEPHGRDASLHRAFASVEAAVRDIDGASQVSRETCAQGSARGAQLAGEMQRAMVGLDEATGCSERFLSMSERLIQDLAHCGCTTTDTPYIEAAQAAAAAIARRLEDALAHGDTTLAALFSDQYTPLRGSQPAQLEHPLNALTDRLFPEVQEPVLAQLPGVVFCIAADRTGYISTHNRQYCKPQRDDPTWNAANSRWRRRFDDRTGLASARNEAPFLLQTYRRDMGGGQFILLKEVSAPIVVQGRHWGGLRLAFRVAD